MTNESDHVERVDVRRVGTDCADPVEDYVAVEEPLEIRLGLLRRGRRIQKPISITMRTPGDDFDLAVGFLHGESIVTSTDQIADVRHCGDPEKGRENTNVVRVELVDDVEVNLMRLERNFYTTSSCGVCGKSSLEALDLQGCRPLPVGDPSVSAALVGELPSRARERQAVFQTTGGLHAAGLFTTDGEWIDLREDVGRHNALDKVIGARFRSGELPARDRIVVLSGRASFELLQKALVAQIPVVVAVGAPSSLAVDLAERFGITLVGFARDGRFNIYSHAERIAA